MAFKKAIHFFFQNHSIRLSHKKILASFILKIFKKEGKRLESLNFIFCSDDYLLKINKDYLGHDFYTDIITFNLSESNERINGEIYISIDRIKENSKELKTKIKLELLRVIFHGVLHLCEYSDKNISQQKEMRKKEDEYLLLFRRFM